LDVGGTAYRTIWVDGDGWTVLAIDQRALPHSFRVLRLSSAADAATAIREMAVRGAPLIGAAGAYGLALAARDDRATTRSSMPTACSPPPARPAPTSSGRSIG
jgi:methylthioribose-1-phosphate isomerase